MTAAWLNPDCVAGKHLACRGDAWDNQADEPTACGCACHAKPAVVRTAEEIRDAIAGIEGEVPISTQMAIAAAASADALRWVIGELDGGRA